MTFDESMEHVPGLGISAHIWSCLPRMRFWLFLTSCCPAVLYPWPLPRSPHKRCCPLPGVAIRWHWEGWGRGWLSFSSYSPSPTPHGGEWSWGGGLTTLGLFRLSKPTATPTPNSSSWHVWWATWRMTRQGLLTPSTTKTKHILA